MKNILIIIVGLQLFAPVSGPAWAQDCRAVALEASQGSADTKILEVRTDKKQNGTVECVVTMRVQESKSEPPRVVTRRLRP